MTGTFLKLNEEIQQIILTKYKRVAISKKNSLPYFLLLPLSS